MFSGFDWWGAFIGTFWFGWLFVGLLYGAWPLVILLGIYLYFNDLTYSLPNTSGSGEERSLHPDLDVRRTVTITASQAAHGCAVRLETPSGNRVQISIPKGVRTGTELRVNRQGMKEGLTAGDIYVKVDIRDDA